MVRQRGVTLIELMIGIALLAILAMAIFPLGRAWVANQQITKTEKEFLEAYSRAKNEALRNPNAVKEDDVAATLKVNNTDKKIEVINSKNVVIWEAVISPTITVTLSTGCTTGHQQLTLNNNGYLRTGSCTYYNIAASGGGNNASGSL